MDYGGGNSTTAEEASKFPTLAYSVKEIEVFEMNDDDDYINEN